MSNPSLSLPALMETRGRKPSRIRHGEAIAEAEGKFADKLPTLADAALELAEGRKPEKCPIHNSVLMCPAGFRLALGAASRLADEARIVVAEFDGPEEVCARISEAVDEFDVLVESGCLAESRGTPADPKMIQYIINRIAGTPTPAGEKQISMDFVRKVTKHIADVFKSCNEMKSPEERAQNFAMGISQLWVLVGESGDGG